MIYYVSINRKDIMCGLAEVIYALRKVRATGEPRSYVVAETVFVGVPSVDSVFMETLAVPDFR